MVKRDSEALRRYFLEKFWEMGIEPIPLEQIANPS